MKHLIAYSILLIVVVLLLAQNSTMRLELRDKQEIIKVQARELIMYREVVEL